MSLHYFKEGVEPVGSLGPIEIVVAGKHCRLSHIVEKGCWRRTAEFGLGKTHVVHVEGTSARVCVPKWRESGGGQVPDLFN